MIIREMREEDLHQVAGIEAAVFSEPWSEQGFAESMQNGYTRFAVAEEEGTIRGYCGYIQTFEEACIINVAVAEEYRKQHIAWNMLNWLMELGRLEGVEHFTLEVRVSNLPAIRLYEKLGFHTEGIRRGFYSCPKEDAAIMWTS